MLIDDTLVRSLIDQQFPQWKNEVVSPVERSGWDNRMFHLGSDRLVRLPSADEYISQVEKEQAWLPVLAKALPLSILTPVGIGLPCKAFPRPWSVYEWIDGETILENIPENLEAVASDLATFLNV